MVRLQRPLLLRFGTERPTTVRTTIGICSMFEAILITSSKGASAVVCSSVDQFHLPKARRFSSVCLSLMQNRGAPVMAMEASRGQMEADLVDDGEAEETCILKLVSV